VRELSPEKQAVIDALKKATANLKFRNMVRKNMLEEHKQFRENKKALELDAVQKSHVYDLDD